MDKNISTSSNSNNMNDNAFDKFLFSDEKEKTMWTNAIFIFDSSALLDVYFLPNTARAKIYSDVFERLPDRLWIPSHVNYEYLKNREKIIEKPIPEKYNPLKKKVKEFKTKAKSDFLKRIEEISRETKKDDKHPHIEQTGIEEFKKNIEQFLEQVKRFENTIVSQIESAEKEVISVKDSDDLLQALEKSFKVGREYSFEEIIEITKEGKHRYEFKIPPGYGDFYNKEKKGTQIFGDLIIWKQILEYSKEVGKPIILITNDIKKDEDWCYLDGNATEDRIYSPREELIKEIYDYSNVDFWMYNLPQFLYNANKYLESNIMEEVIQNFSQLLNTKNKAGDYLKFKCEKCGRLHKYNGTEFNLDFDCVGTSERNMGTENQYRAEEYFKCTCGNEITAKFEVWEYPIGGHNYDSTELSGAKLLESFYFTIDFFANEREHDLHMCDECEGNKDGVGNYYYLYDDIPIDNDYDNSAPEHKYNSTNGGACQYCSTLHIRCPQCNSTTAFPEVDTDVECEGGCGLVFNLETGDPRDSSDERILKIIDNRKVKCNSCGELFIDDRHIEMCYECEEKLNSN